MPENKRQHYVPRVYLSLFSENKKSINFVQVDQLTSNNNVAIKNQCQQAYFYGQLPKDGDPFSKIEDKIAPLFSKILQNKPPPAESSQEHELLITFVILQTLRTRRAGDESEEATTKLSKSIAEHSRVNIENIQFKYNNPVLMSLHDARPSILLSKDLRIKVVKNETSQDLICSDHPVIIYNQFLEDQQLPGGHSGFAQRGFQMFLPLGPRHLLVFFDSGIYKIGSQKQKIIAARNEKDILWQNKLQILNAKNCIYFRNPNDTDHLINECKSAKTSRLPELFSIKTAYKKQTEKGTETLLLYNRVDHKINLSLSFLKRRKNKNIGKPNFGTIEVRNPNLCYQIEKFRKQTTSQYD